jgi:hypothetical protein
MPTIATLTVIAWSTSLRSGKNGCGSAAKEKATTLPFDKMRTVSSRRRATVRKKWHQKNVLWWLFLIFHIEFYA